MMYLEENKNESWVSQLSSQELKRKIAKDTFTPEV